ncbi:hypothetical protein S7711_06846 [Stachybotrys chartarum IBT 7711]|uniref:NADP-dependent oxidoreductase domain-containing protein n=1 Tax=Stachybotrys chartarum (strain CBS 109288 / IBT 7711) TaxID=1280523 RepID=A0A084B798_STACB|nr:hypothetical protein S7711_06846 [Stachybotrys chartarum IBT 7711]KFA48105.1 hypothetical protein S40293_08358 [Stachybotrys chartarum IBT 40293]KFA81401.1 hypothetical protein S40288_08386 [Stachybotrys chartarum IBT 40288]
MSPSLRTLGRNGPEVSAVGLGLMSIGGVYGPKGTDEERFRLLDRAHELGATFWDTADVYFDSEDVVGKWFAKSGKRKDIFLATKFALKMSEDNKLIADTSPEYVRAACERSLQRLGIDKIDLYYCHRVDGKTPIEETMKALVELKSEGKIDYIGLSEVSSETLRRAHAVHPISAFQVEYSPFCLEIEEPRTNLLQTCRELGIAVVAYSPIGRGLLTGFKTWDHVAADSFLSTMPKFSKENFPKILNLVDKLKEISSRKGCTPAQLSLAWVLAQGNDFIPIPGTRSSKYLEENVQSATVELTAEDKEEIVAAIRQTELPGDRYSEANGAGLLLLDTPPLQK